MEPGSYQLCRGNCLSVHGATLRGASSMVCCHETRIASGEGRGRWRGRRPYPRQGQSFGNPLICWPPMMPMPFLSERDDAMPSHRSTPPEPSESEKTQRIAWLVLDAALIALAVWVLREFITPIIWAGVV